MLKADKEKVVAELAERLRTAQTLIVADYRGLTMTEIDRLRTQLLEHGARFSVVKNTLTRRAAEAAGIEPLLALLEGPTAIAFLDADGDPIAVAKALSETARTTRVLTVRGGILEGKPVGEDEVKSLATLPPADQLAPRPGRCPRGANRAAPGAGRGHRGARGPRRGACRRGGARS